MAKVAVGGHEVGKAICDALGIDGAKVSRIYIDIRADRMVEVEITRGIAVEELEQIVEVLTAYELVRR